MFDCIANVASILGLAATIVTLVKIWSVRKLLTRQQRFPEHLEALNKRVKSMLRDINSSVGGKVNKDSFRSRLSFSEVDLENLEKLSEGEPKTRIKIAMAEIKAWRNNASVTDERPLLENLEKLCYFLDQEEENRKAGAR